MIRSEFTGMLPAAISKFEEFLDLAKAQDLNINIVKGFDGTQGSDSYFCWGCAIQVVCLDLVSLRTLAESIGIIVYDENINVVNLAYTNNLTIDDFKTYRVNGQLELTEEKKIV